MSGVLSAAVALVLLGGTQVCKKNLFNKLYVYFSEFCVIGINV